MATAMETTIGRRNLWGSALKLIAAVLLVMMALSAAGTGADAKPSPASYQNGFNKACRDHGGTTKRVGSRVVRCTLPDGTTITCDFNTNPPACTKKAALVVGDWSDAGDVPVLEGASAGEAPATGAAVVSTTPDRVVEARAVDRGGAIFQVEETEGR